MILRLKLPLLYDGKILSAGTYFTADADVVSRLISIGSAEDATQDFIKLRSRPNGEHKTPHVEDIKENLMETRDNSSDETPFAPPPQGSAEPVAVSVPDSREEEKTQAIARWEAVISHLRGAEHTAAKLAIEKWRGKSHAEAYNAAIPDGNANRPKEFVSKKKSVAQMVADSHNLPMPDWQPKP